MYLPEAGYPASGSGYPDALNESSHLYDVNRTQECMNRCVDAADKNLTGYSTVDTKIRDLAFYVRESDQHCACSSGACNTVTDDFDVAYISYYIVAGKS